jgi:hypothetical protein
VLLIFGLAGCNRLQYGLAMDEITLQKRRIQQLVADGRVNKSTLARMCGFGQSALNTMLDEGWNPTTRVLAALVRAANELGFPRRPKRARGNDRDGLAA